MRKGILIAVVGLALSSSAYSMDLVNSLATDYSNNVDISNSLSKIKKEQRELARMVKDKELLNVLEFISIRLNELESIKNLPVTKERVKRVLDISKELTEAKNYIKKAIKHRRNWSLASL